MATKKANGASDDKIVHIPLRDLIVDMEWNVRYGDWTADSGTGDSDDSGGHEFKELKASIGTKGQDTPIVVRPKGKKYQVVVGFRRFAAISQLADEAKDKNATIKAVVKNLNDAEAFAENMRENTARENLNAPDSAFGILRIHDSQKAAGGTPTSVSLATETGLNQSYVAMLLRIMLGLKPAIAQAWRKAKVKVSLKELEKIAKLEKTEQDKAFQEAIKNKEAIAKGPNAWVDGAVKRAEDIGTLIGSLERDELIDAGALSFEAHILVWFPKLNKKATTSQKRKIAKAAEDAWAKAKEAPPPAEETQQAAAN
jgi:ParB/RepB/Spo0J family partition protein